MSEQLQLRRGTAAQVAAFTGAPGEVVVDTTNNRIVLQDGATAGGFAAAKLSEVLANTRTAVSDASYAALTSDRMIAYTAITAARVVSLPAASAYPTGTQLLIVDESGAASSTRTITASRAGADTIDGLTSAVIAGPYGVLGLESNGSNKWTVTQSRAFSTARTPIADAAYTVLATDRMVAYTALTAARATTLCAASAYPAGTVLWIVDESGSCSAVNTITVNRAGSDTIDGGASQVLNGAYMAIGLESNGSNAWTAVANFPNDEFNLVGIGTPPDPANPLSVFAASALFSSGGDFRITINKNAPANTASFIFEDNFSERAEIGLTGDDNFHFKVSANGAVFNTGILIDAATGAVTLGNARTAVNDAAYAALATDREVAYTAITAARAVTLPAASAYPAGADLLIVDESGACSPINTISVNRAGSDTIDGKTSTVLSSAFGFVRLRCDGVSKWVTIGRSANLLSFTSSGTYTPSPGMQFCDVYCLGGGGGGGGGALEVSGTACSGGGGGGGGMLTEARFSAAQIGASQAVTIGAGGAGGAAASASTTVGGNGSNGGGTNFGPLLAAGRGGGGAGGQISATASGGGAGSGFVSGTGSTGATGGAAGLGGATGGSGAAGASNAAGGAGGGGSSVGGVAAVGGNSAGGGSGGGAGGGLTAIPATNAGAAGGNQFSNGFSVVGGAGGAANTNGSPGATPTLYNLNISAGSGGGGGGSALTATAAGAGGAGGLGAGGGGGGSAINGGTAGAGGPGGGGVCYIVEIF